MNDTERFTEAFLLCIQALIENHLGLNCEAKVHMQDAERKIKMLNEKMELDRKLNAVQK